MTEQRSPGRVLWKAVLAALVIPTASVLLLALYAAVIWLRVPSAETIGARLGAQGDPGPTSFMAEDGCVGHRREYRPIDQIDPRLVCTVVWAEDWRFFRHDGVDWSALEGAMRDNWRRTQLRLGGSSIPMQLARNLFLSRARTPSRKLREIAIAERLVTALGRKRVLELYLNAAEWAPCVYGVEAATRHYLGHDATVIDAAEAVFLASMLPRPGRPPGALEGDRRRLLRRQQFLLTTLGRAGLLAPAAVRRGRAAVFKLLGAQIRRARQSHRATTDREVGSPGAGESGAVSGLEGRLTDGPAPVSWLARACGTAPPKS